MSPHCRNEFCGRRLKLKLHAHVPVFSRNCGYPVVLTLFCTKQCFAKGDFDLPTPQDLAHSLNLYETSDDTASLKFIAINYGENVTYYWPSINLTKVEYDSSGFEVLLEISNSTENENPPSSDLTKRAQRTCYNSNKSYKITGCSNCGKFKGYLSAHNCKSKGNKGYSCLEACKCVLNAPDGHCSSTQCDEYCGAVNAFATAEGGGCWTGKCKTETVHAVL
ncbi:hypothetical protein CANTEDRAFT_133367 [Yamadazyma tenuis ATCC 10573]|uniref:Uncharacterized protein n=1 Tax=Candida tenuis (strain ATCC 10573 / BCRC 21748 / CBS 615 / JCM 9827 / NBRC 10315 / NRRL Y-1498 / VKM Y-70) TaxID=590646 RepID=G3AYV4_CANTC|nr:uncharacterized protein CANTEDRAFT_133367 [Yamadazyma tenuis ATCC 10573]EGV65938.1 hypothetical protein CANTEDRAFT_133367 [Yamadazyma tenuis ATCC 10573]